MILSCRTYKDLDLLNSSQLLIYIGIFINIISMTLLENLKYRILIFSNFNFLRQI